jgi:hypothetical protein
MMTFLKNNDDGGFKPSEGGIANAQQFALVAAQ